MKISDLNKSTLLRILRKKRFATVVVSWFLLTIAACFFGVKKIHSDLQERAETALQEKSLDWAEISFYGRGKKALLYGEAPTQQAKDQALQTLSSLWGVSSVEFLGQIAPVETISPSFSLAMVDEAIQVDGNLAQNKQFDLIMQGLKIIAADRQLVNRIELSSNVDNFPELLPLIMKLQCCTSLNLVKFENDQLLIQGRVYSELEKIALEKSINIIFDESVEKKFQLKVRAIEKDISLGVKKCARELNRIMSIEELQFERSVSRLNSSSTPLLTLLSDTIQQCEADSFTIVNELSAKGSDRINISLSRARASAVKQALADLGVTEEKMISVGKLLAMDKQDNPLNRISIEVK